MSDTLEPVEIRPRGRRGPAKDATNGQQAPPNPGSDDSRPGSSLLGLESNTWSSADGFVSIQFRRAPGGTGERISRILGPQQSTNAPVVRIFRALATISHINGEPIGSGRVPRPKTEAQYRSLMNFFGPTIDGQSYYDENLEAFVAASEIALNPEYFEMLDQAMDLGLSPQDVERIRTAIGLSNVKK
jgi:hypothetical protein